MPDDIEGQESTEVQTQEQVAAPEVAAQEDHSTDTQTEANPFWGEVEKKVGPNVYKLIQPDLARADTEARNRISTLNQSYAPWKAFADRGIAPQHVEQALGVVQQLNTSPEQVFTSLQQFLEREGRLPTKTELKQEVIEDEAGEGDGENPLAKQVKAMQEQQALIAQFLQNQQLTEQRKVEDQAAESWLTTETDNLKAKGFDQDDIKEIVRIAAFRTQQSGQDPDSLEAAANEFVALRDRIRTAPRPTTLAPRLPSGPGGGTPSTGTIDPSTMTREQRMEAALAVMSRSRQS